MILRKQLFQQAEGYLELGMASHALEAVLRLDDQGSQDPHAQYLRGEALRSLQRYDEAIPWLQQASDANPDNVHVWLALGWCYKRCEELHRAIYALENALQASPEDAIIHYNLACYWSLAGSKAQVLEYLAQAFELDPTFRELVHEEPDFDALRDDPDFQAIATVIV